MNTFELKYYMMKRCVVCHLPMKKDEAVVTLHYEVKYEDEDKIITTNNITVHLDCRMSAQGKELLNLRY